MKNLKLHFQGIAVLMFLVLMFSCSDEDQDETTNDASNAKDCGNYHYPQEYLDSLPSLAQRTDLDQCTPRDLFNERIHVGCGAVPSDENECFRGTEDCTEQPDGYCFSDNYGSEPCKCHYGKFDCLVTTKEPADECNLNTECTEKANGYCYSPHGSTPCKCFYQDCDLDADCADDEICVCSPNEHNRVCVKSCKGDEECGEGQRCQLAGRYYCDMLANGTMGYRCSSENDECKSDCDCSAPDGICVFSESSGYFKCEAAMAYSSTCE